MCFTLGRIFLSVSCSINRKHFFSLASYYFLSISVPISINLSEDQHATYIEWRDRLDSHVTNVIMNVTQHYPAVGVEFVTSNSMFSSDTIRLPFLTGSTAGYSSKRRTVRPCDEYKSYINTAIFRQLRLWPSWTRTKIYVARQVQQITTILHRCVVSANYSNSLRDYFHIVHLYFDSGGKSVSQSFVRVISSLRNVFSLITTQHMNPIG